MNTLYHADDFGITLEQSRRILDCSSACGGRGALTGISLLVNGPDAAACAELLKPYRTSLLISLHTNLVEGPCCADPSDIPLLVDDRNMFALSYGRMLAGSFGPGSRELERQVALEIGAQLDRFLAFFPELRGRLRIDSHQHFHLIPCVFRALSTAIASRGCTVEFVRIPAEPLTPFLAAPDAIRRVPPINWVKHALLNALWALDKRADPAFAREASGKSAVFCGINLGGHMTLENVQSALPSFEAYAARHARDLELLFHPGPIDRAEDSLDPELTGFVQAETSPYRWKEHEALQALGQRTATHATPER